MDELVVDDAGGVRTITINRPEVKNALTAAMRTEFCALIDEADADDGTRAIIVTAVDPVFDRGRRLQGGGRRLRPRLVDQSGRHAPGGHHADRVRGQRRVRHGRGWRSR